MVISGHRRDARPPCGVRGAVRAAGVWGPQGAVRALVAVAVLGTLVLLVALGGCGLIVDPPRLGGVADECGAGRCVVGAAVAHHETSAAAPEVVATLDLPAAAVGEDWVVLASGRMSWETDVGDGLSPVQVHCSVDGVRRTEAEGALEDEDGDGRVDGSAPWQHVDVVRAAASTRVEVSLQSLSGGPVRLDDLALLAFRVPPGADLQLEDTPTLRSVDETAAWVPVERLTITPSAAGDYLVLAAAVLSRSPATAGAGVRVAAPGGVAWPLSSGGTLPYLGNPLDHAQPVLLARVASLGAEPADFAIEVAPGPGGSEVQFTRLIALRVDAFAAFAQSTVLGEQDFASATPAVAGQLELTALDAPRDWIVLQSVALMAGGWRHVSFDGPDDLAVSQFFGSGDLKITYGRSGTVWTADPLLVTTQVWAGGAASPVNAKESVLFALALP